VNSNPPPPGKGINFEKNRKKKELEKEQANALGISKAELKRRRKAALEKGEQLVVGVPQVKQGVSAKILKKVEEDIVRGRQPAPGRIRVGPAKRARSASGARSVSRKRSNSVMSSVSGYESGTSKRRRSKRSPSLKSIEIAPSGKLRRPEKVIQKKGVMSRRDPRYDGDDEIPMDKYLKEIAKRKLPKSQHEMIEIEVVPIVESVGIKSKRKIQKLIDLEAQVMGEIEGFKNAIMRSIQGCSDVLLNRVSFLFAQHYKKA